MQELRTDRQSGQEQRLREVQLRIHPAAVSSIPAWLEERKEAATAVQRTEESREIIVGPARHVRGPSDARFTLVEFGDFSCPDCAHAVPIIAEQLSRHPRDLRYIFRH